MFKYDSDSNTLIEVTETTFSDNNILERDHIEEWIRKKPDILGEELLMIGHEYDKFDTNDRLDLLAIDKDGKLVIIELKRDKSGSTVDFQTLKYCSYCSQLTPQDILELFSEYLSKHGIKAEPVDIITDFLEIPQGNEDSLNEMLNNSQRFIIIGKEIDKRILSVCAWLYENGIEAKCLRIVPYINDQKELYIDIDQIIPPYEIGDYYVQKKEIQQRDRKIHQPEYIIDFFGEIVEKIRSETNFKINYNPRKAYCNIRSGGKIGYALRYFKRNGSFSIHALIKDADQKDKLEQFYKTNSAELSSVVGHKVHYQPEGDRNPNWTYIRVLIDAGNDSDLISKVQEIGQLFIKFCSYFEEKWKE